MIDLAAGVAALAAAYLVRNEREWLMLGIGLGVFFFVKASTQG